MVLPNDPNSRVSEAGALIRSGRSAAAIPLLDDFLVGTPTDTWALAERGRARSFTGDYNGALTDFTEIIRLKPESAHSFTGRASIHARAGISYRRSGYGKRLATSQIMTACIH
jgi:Flp pilus assembly protein TadD